MVRNWQVVRGVNKKTLQNEPESQVFGSLSTIFLDYKKTVPYLIHYLILHHWSKFRQIWLHLKEYSIENHPKWDQDGCFHASMLPDINFTLNLSFANSVIPLPQGFLYSVLLFWDTDIALQTINKAISVFPKTLWYWVCHFHCNKIEIKKNWKIILKQQQNYYLSGYLFSRISRKLLFVSSYTSNLL